MLQDWYQPYPGSFFYFPGRKQRTACYSDLIKMPRLLRSSVAGVGTKALSCQVDDRSVTLGLSGLRIT